MQEKYRLKKKYQFNYIFKRGRSYACRSLVLICAGNGNGKLKAGFSVGKKIGKATVRNKVKRRLKEIFRKRIPSLDPRLNYILVPREDAAKLTFAELERDVEYVLKKAVGGAEKK